MELLLVIAVVAILFGILAPALAGARASAKALACAARIREVGALVTAYTGESAGVFPAWLDGREYRHDPSKWQTYTFQTFSTLPSPRWLEWSGLETESEIFYCPANQQFPESYQTMASPDYVMSACLFGEVSYFNEALTESMWQSRLGDRVQSVAAAAFPADKVGLLELFVWHGWGKSICADCPQGDLEYTQSPSPGSLWFIDGHVEQVMASLALPYVDRYPIWPYMPFGTTVDGIGGRDR